MEAEETSINKYIPKTMCVVKRRGPKNCFLYEVVHGGVHDEVPFEHILAGSEELSFKNIRGKENYRPRNQQVQMP